ncbi:12542_t:CDS:2, partial [Funneliformis mosseae]
RKGGVDELSLNLQQSGFDCGALHGDMMQADRDKMLRDFKNNKFPIMVATDVASRGLDIKAVKTVVNYDIARDIDSHVHRIGRTGRAAYTLITKKEDKFAGDLVRNLESSGQIVPSSLMDLAMQNARFRKSRQLIRGGRRGSAGSSSNAIPLGSGRAGIGSVGSQIPPPPQLSTTSNRSGRNNAAGFQSKLQVNFQKASSSESELGLLRSSNTSSSSTNSTTSPSVPQQRKRRWDS